MTKFNKLLLVAVLASPLLLGAVKSFYTDIDIKGRLLTSGVERIDGSGNLLNINKLVRLPSNQQTLTSASNTISANAAVVQVAPNGPTLTASKSTNNTKTSLNSVSGATAGDYPLRMTTSNETPPAVRFYWNGTICSACPYNGWPSSQQISINSGGLAGTLTFTVDNTGPGPNIDSTDTVTVAESSADLTLTSTPTITDGSDGEEVIILNTGSNNLTLNDQGTPSSNLRLVSATIVLGPRDSVRLLFSSSVGDWVQVAPLVNVL